MIQQQNTNQTIAIISDTQQDSDEDFEENDTEDTTLSGPGSGMQQIYIHTEEAEQVTQNADFLALYDHFMELVEIAEDEGCDVAEDLPKEDDEGDTEYKYKLCGLTLDKLEKRTTQMAFRLCVSKIIFF